MNSATVVAVEIPACLDQTNDDFSGIFLPLKAGRKFFEESEVRIIYLASRKSGFYVDSLPDLVVIDDIVGTSITKMDDNRPAFHFVIHIPRSHVNTSDSRWA